MSRPLGYLSLALATRCGLGVSLVDRLGIERTVAGVDVAYLLSDSLSVLTIVLATYGLYRIGLVAFDRQTPDKRRPTTRATSSGSPSAWRGPSPSSGS